MPHCQLAELLVGEPWDRVRGLAGSVLHGVYRLASKSTLSRARCARSEQTMREHPPLMPGASMDTAFHILKKHRMTERSPPPMTQLIAMPARGRNVGKLIGPTIAPRLQVLGGALQSFACCVVQSRQAEFCWRTQPHADPAVVAPVTLVVKGSRARAAHPSTH